MYLEVLCLLSAEENSWKIDLQNEHALKDAATTETK
jgi:hypothetical protein